MSSAPTTAGAPHIRHLTDPKSQGAKGIEGIPEGFTKGSRRVYEGFPKASLRRCLRKFSFLNQCVRQGAQVAPKGSKG
jgi:hypothetical protein